MKKVIRLSSLILVNFSGAIILTLVFCSLLLAETRTIRLTNNLYPDLYPYMQGDLLVWQAFIDDNPLDYKEGDWEIFVCRLSTLKIEQVTNNEGDDLSPVTNGQYIVWQGKGELSNEIFLYNYQSKIISQVTNDTNEDLFPQIWADWVVWSSMAQNKGTFWPGEIFLYSISANRLTLLSESIDPGNIYHDNSPQIGYVEQKDKALEGNMVFWSQDRGQTSVFFLYNLDLGRFEQVPDDFLWPEKRQRNDRFQVVSRRGTEREILVYDLLTGRYRQLTNNTYPDRYPCLQDNKIAWMAGDGDSSEIFFAVYDPNSIISIPFDSNPLIQDSSSDPVIPPSPFSPKGGRSAPLSPPSRCFISCFQP